MRSPEIVLGIEGRPTRGESKSATAFWRIVVLAATVTVALPVGISLAVEKAGGALVTVPCPDGSAAECVPASLFADEGEFSLNNWRVSPGCIENK